MTIEKRGNKYRIVQMVDGVRYRITLDHKPSQAEALKLLAKEIESNTISEDMPFKRACDLYIESKSNVLSPSSIRGYRSVIKQISPILMNTKLSSVTLPIVQTEINSYSAAHSPKSACNYSGFIMSVLKFYGVNISSPKLPQKEKKSPYIPTKEEVIAIFNEVKNTKYEIPILLSSMGLRRSEIAALDEGDLVGNVLTINKAKVQDENKQWIIKTTKTEDSTRTIILPDYLVGLINERGFYKGHPELIYRTLVNTQKKLGIPHFPLHKMRHFFASYMHSLGQFSDKQIQEMGGWKNASTLQKIYTHAMEIDRAKKDAAEVMSEIYPKFTPSEKKKPIK